MDRGYPSDPRLRPPVRAGAVPFGVPGPGQGPLTEQGAPILDLASPAAQLEVCLSRLSIGGSPLIGTADQTLYYIIQRREGATDEAAVLGWSLDLGSTFPDADPAAGTDPFDGSANRPFPWGNQYGLFAGVVVGLASALPLPLRTAARNAWVLGETIARWIRPTAASEIRTDQDVPSQRYMRRFPPGSLKSPDTTRRDTWTVRDTPQSWRLTRGDALIVALMLPGDVLTGRANRWWHGLIQGEILLGLRTAPQAFGARG